MRACKSCKALTELETCPNCKGPTTQYGWSGYVGIIYPDQSKIAKKMGLENKPAGEYALKVR
ncbi:MAG: DNA-directed RNA polymerase subunit E [Candidatus Altiarchaeota archaeon]|nr:DNA-directed RNA polymerase subunit E [Candidatus Altiarchaeota archaeon]